MTDPIHFSSDGKTAMQQSRFLRNSSLTLFGMMLLLSACSGEAETEAVSTLEAPVMSAAEPDDGEAVEDEIGEDEGEERAAEVVEEDGSYIAIHDIWDATLEGARLMLSFNESMGAFRGTVQNTTATKICAVRVMISLAGGTEIGPTENTELAPGEVSEITLSTEGNSFDKWTARSEFSAC